MSAKIHCCHCQMWGSHRSDDCPSIKAQHSFAEARGSVARVESEVCGDCEGSGVVLKTNGWMLFDGKCKRCSGTGRIEPTKPLNAPHEPCGATIKKCEHANK